MEERDIHERKRKREEVDEIKEKAKKEKEWKEQWEVCLHNNEGLYTGTPFRNEGLALLQRWPLGFFCIVHFGPGCLAFS